MSSARPENGFQLPSAGSEYRDELVDSGADFHDRTVDPDRTLNGSLSGAPSFPRRFGGRLERGRPRYKRQFAPASFPQNPRRRASRALGHATGRRSVAHHEFHPFESAKHRLPFPKSLDGRNYTASLAISRCSVASAFCKIGRASCRERGEFCVVTEWLM